MKITDILLLIGKLIVVAAIIWFVCRWVPSLNHFTLLDADAKQTQESYQERQGEFVKLFSEYNKVARIPPAFEKTYKKMPPLMIATPEEEAMYLRLQSFFSGLIGNISKKHDIPITIDRTIYDIYYSNSNVIFDAVVIVENKEANITERYFLKLFVKVGGVTPSATPVPSPRPSAQSPGVEPMYISIDDPDDEPLVGANARTDEISKDNGMTKPIYEMEIESALGKLYTLNRIDKLPNYHISYQKYPYLTKFVFNDFFKKELVSKVAGILGGNGTDTFDKKSGKPGGGGTRSAFSILRDVYDIYYQDNGPDRNYVFSADVFIHSSALTLPLVVLVTIQDLDRFLTPDGNFAANVRDLVKPDDFLLRRLERRQTVDATTPIPTPLHISFTPESEYDSGDYYRFRSKLNLMGPTFEEDYRSMEISPEMEASFKEKITPETIQKRLSMCFGPGGDPTNSKTREQCEIEGGLWDSPPITDNDCPFYKANTLYPNQYGRITGYSCELPRNMKSLGYKKFLTDTDSAPLCYNCKTGTIGEGTLGFCCEDQMNPLEYPGLLSPDYAFQGDAQTRQQHRGLIELNKLSVT